MKKRRCRKNKIDNNISSSTKKNNDDCMNENK